MRPKSCRGGNFVSILPELWISQKEWTPPKRTVIIPLLKGRNGGVDGDDVYLGVSYSVCGDYPVAILPRYRPIFDKKSRVMRSTFIQASGGLLLLSKSKDGK